MILLYDISKKKCASLPITTRLRFVLQQHFILKINVLTEHLTLIEKKMQNKKLQIYRFPS